MTDGDPALVLLTATMPEVWKLVLFVVPLGLDTFAVSAALGLQGVSSRARWRISLLMSGFEMAMPLLGLAIGRGLGTLIGSAADWIAVAVLIALGLYVLIADEDESDRLRALADGRGPAMLALGLSISLDEFAIGFTIGLLHLPIWLAILLIGLQAFVLAQAGLRLGGRLGKSAGESAERLAGCALIALGVVLALEQTL
jgi:putative Mn2+ efflux pump MntP